MLTPTRFALENAALAAALAIVLFAPTAGARTIIDDWSSVKSPPPPALHAVTIDPKTTASLMLDFNHQTCNPQRRAECVASIPRVDKLLKEARAAGATVAYSVGGGGTKADIPAEIAPENDEPVVSSGVDKFHHTDLEAVLRKEGVKTVIVVGTGASGAVLYTASAAAMLGFKVIVPVDGMSGEIPYVDQYVAWHLANAPLVSKAVTLTAIDDVTF